MPETLKKKTVNGIIWSSFERFSVQGIQLTVMIVMARLLSPEEFGLVGLLAIFLAISQSLIDSGFSNALIRKQDRTETDFSTVFYFNIAIGIFLYIIMFFGASLIADFYNRPILIPLTRIISINLIINSLTVVQRAKLTINVDFKTQAKASFLGVVCSGFVGIMMAYKGLGVWSLVGQSIVNSLTNGLALWLFSRWKPISDLSINSFKILFSFGSKILLTGLIGTLYNNIYTIIIGKAYSVAELGYFTQANNFSRFPSSNFSGVLERVTYPILCKVDNDLNLLHLFRNYIRLSSYIVFPLMIGLSFLSKSFIMVFLGEKWIYAATLLSILCISYMWYPLHSININLLQVKNRPDLLLKLEIIKKIMSIFIMIATIPFGLKTMCIGCVLSSLLCVFINTYYSSKLLDYNLYNQFCDIFPSLIMSTIMGLCVFLMTKIIDSSYLELVIGVILGTVLYILFSVISKSNEFSILIKLIKK